MADDYNQNTNELSIKQIPKFQFQLHNDELVNCIKQLTFNMKNQDKAIQKMKKDIQLRISQSQITQVLVLINSLIEIDPSLSKLLKSKSNKKQDLSNHPINNSGNQLGRKINQLSQSITILYNLIKNNEKKINDLQFNTKSTLSQKVNILQQQIDENNSKFNSQIMQLKQKIQLSNATFGDKVREVETKTLWQINDCKVRLNSCINQQYVKDANKQLQGKIHTKMKQQMLKQGSIDPQRISKMQQNIMKNQKQFASQLTETNYKIQVIKDNIQKTLMTKKQYGDQRIQLQKRFGLLNTNFSDAIRRIRQIEGQILQQKQKSKKMDQFSQSISKQTYRMNQVLKNLKIGDDFQKMLQKMDPHKICELDDRVNDLTIGQQKLTKMLGLCQKQVDRLRSKTQFTGVLSPNTSANSNNSKISKQQIQSIITQYFNNNLFAKKIQSLQSQFLQVKAFPDMINQINKQIARIQKQTDTQSLIYQLKGLQQYIKKQILIVNNRINNIQLQLKQEKKRPSSAAKLLNSDNKLSSSVSYKKLTPASNCISCYNTSMPTNGLSLGNNAYGSGYGFRKNSVQKF